MTTIDCKILTAEADIEVIATLWRELYARASRSPFVDYDLFMIWWRNVGKVDGKRVHVVAGWEGGKLVAVLPLTVAHRGGMRIMQAAGYRAYNYADMLAETPEQALAVWQAARGSPHYDFADIRDVYPESQCHEALSAFARRRDESNAYAIRFQWPTGEAWRDALPKAMRNNFKRCSKRLEELGALSYEVYKEGHLPVDVMTAMVEQKVAWSKANNMPGLFGHSGVRDYYHQAMESAAKQGQLFLAWLKCGDKIIAYNQGFYHSGTIHMPFWTYDPSWGKYSPGTVILSNTIMFAINSGLKGIDMRQGESQIKRKHSNEIRQCAEFTFNGSARGMLIEKAYMGARALLRKVRQIKNKSAESEKEE